MELVEIQHKIKSQNYIEPEMVYSAFQFWFTDSEHIRTPFPEYIHDILKERALEDLLIWTSKLTDKAKKDINDEILAEKFEEIIFEIAHDLVLTEDEKLTVKYPFLLRMGDEIEVKGVAETMNKSVVVKRELVKRGDEVFMTVHLCNNITKENWETEFELPE